MLIKPDRLDDFLGIIRAKDLTVHDIYIVQGAANHSFLGRTAVRHDDYIAIFDYGVFTIHDLDDCSELRFIIAPRGHKVVLEQY